MTLNRIIRFFRKHRFPKHFVGIMDILTAFSSRTLWTLHARLMLGLQGCSPGVRFSTDGRLLARTSSWGGIQIGKSFTANSRSGANLTGLTNPTILSCEYAGSIQIGDHCGFSSVVISSRSAVSIGNRTMIGANARIFDHDFHSLNPLDRQHMETDQAGCISLPVTIGQDVFIGTNSIILKGVEIGDRSVIAAGTVVIRSTIPPDSLVAGNPARIVRSLRPPNETF